MFIGDSTAHVQRPALAGALALFACVAVLGAAGLLTRLSAEREGAPILLANAAPIESEWAARGGDVWVLTTPDCAACGAALNDDLAALADAGASVRIIEAAAWRSSPVAAIVRALTDQAEASTGSSVQVLDAALTQRASALPAPIFVWRGPDGDWRAMSGARVDAGRRIAGELRGRA
jgi:hypothetical protein